MAQTITMTPADGVNRVCNVAYLDTGTVAAYEFEIGFQPKYVKLVNTNGSGLVQIEWFEGMTNGHGVKTAANGTRSTITSNGITVAANGFTMGLDTDLNVTSEQVYGIAIG